MYAAFFGLSHPPFSIAPDPRYLFLSERHREALAHLLYGVDSGGGFVLLTGEIGAGKTTVCRRFLEQIPENARVAYIFNPKLTVEDLLQTVCNEFGVEVDLRRQGVGSVKGYLDPLNAHLLACHAAGEQSLLIIDEAQSLSAEVLEQLRLLTNLETNERKLLQIILIGQPELRHMLCRPELEQLAQRVIARFHLGPLSETETRQYIAHRMAIAGWKADLPFTRDALRQIHKLTRGIPRRINLLCDRALLGAYAVAHQTINTAIVKQSSFEVFDSQATSNIGANRSQVPRFGISMIAALTAGAALSWGASALWNKEIALPTWPKVATDLPEAASDITQPKSSPSPSRSPEKSLSAALPQGPMVFEKEALPLMASLPAGPPPSEQWISEEDAAFVALGSVWGQALGDKNPCEQARQHGLQCYRTARMTLNGLRQMDRPAALKLHLPGQKSGYVLATRIDDQSIALSVGQISWRLPLTALSPIWSGYYVTLWRTPPGQAGRMNNGYHGTAATWMAEQLDKLQARGDIPTSATTLEAKVEAFQRANGLEVNGRASPTTFIILNLASKVNEPRLASKTP